MPNRVRKLTIARSVSRTISRRRTPTLPPLTIKGRTISFLIAGGGCFNDFSTRAELIIDDKVAFVSNFLLYTLSSCSTLDVISENPYHACICSCLQVVRKETGGCSETMTRKTWDVKAFIGQRARVKLVDSSSDHWGHINFDDLKGDISCEDYIKGS